MRQIQQCRHGTERHQLQEHRLIVLDTDADLNGLELSWMLPPRHPYRFYHGGFDQYALDGFKVNALDYLLKPINYNEF